MMTKEEANQEISNLLEVAKNSLEAAKQLARENSLFFSCSLGAGEDFYGNKEAYASYKGYDNFEEFEKQVGEHKAYLPEKFEWIDHSKGFWMSSSDYC